MRRRLFTLGKTAVYLHLATPLMGAYVLLCGQGKLLGLAFLSILLHEGGHGLMAAVLGHPPQSVELTPLGCLLRLDEEGALPWGKRLMVVLAGPCVTLVLAWLAVHLTGGNVLPRETGRMLYRTNLALLLVNLLPALPLDGGRLMSLLLGCFLPPDRVRQWMQGVGSALGLGLVGLNAALCIRWGGWNLSLSWVGCFLLYAARMGTMTAAMEQLMQLMDRKSRMELRGSLPVAEVAVMEGTPLHQVVQRLHPSRYTRVVVLKMGTMEEKSVLGEAEIVKAWMGGAGDDGL